MLVASLKPGLLETIIASIPGVLARAEIAIGRIPLNLIRLVPV